jgi:hypothetical protein
MERYRLPDPIETVRGQGLKLSAAILPTFGSGQEKQKVSIKVQYPAGVANQVIF